MVSGSERYIQEYRARKARGAPDVAPPSHRRMVALTAAFSPIVAFAVFPVTAIVAVLASILARATTGWVGAVVVVVAVVGFGYFTARWSMSYGRVPAVRGWRRWLPLTATVVVVALCLAEILSGGRTPDPVIMLWVASMVWVAAFLPLAAGEWGPARRVLWAIAPALASVVILLLWTQGFFAWRFDRAVSALDDVAQRVAEGERVDDGTTAGGFTVYDVNLGRLGRNAGCDTEFWITGWHDDDTRYIAHCVEDPAGDDFTHLAGDWWELEGKRPPSNLGDG